MSDFVLKAVKSLLKSITELETLEKAGGFRRGLGNAIQRFGRFVGGEPEKKKEELVPLEPGLFRMLYGDPKENPKPKPKPKTPPAPSSVTTTAAVPPGAPSPAVTSTGAVPPSPAVTSTGAVPPTPPSPAVTSTVAVPPTPPTPPSPAVTSTVAVPPTPPTPPTPPSPAVTTTAAVTTGAPLPVPLPLPVPVPVPPSPAVTSTGAVPPGTPSTAVTSTGAVPPGAPSPAVTTTIDPKVAEERRQQREERKKLYNDTGLAKIFFDLDKEYDNAATPQERAALDKLKIDLQDERDMLLNQVQKAIRQGKGNLSEEQIKQIIQKAQQTFYEQENIFRRRRGLPPAKRRL